MTHDIYLIVYHSPLFPAHWALWIPSANNSQIGKKLHVFGDVANGFEHEFQRNYNPFNDQLKHSLVLLAEVEEKNVVDVPGDGSQTSDKNAMDDIERVALATLAPSKSLKASTDGTKHKVQIQNCQTYIYQLVAALVTAKIVHCASTTLLDNAPKN